MADNYELSGKKIWVAGSQGMVGSALIRRLKNENCKILETARKDLDLTHEGAVDEWFKTHKPQAVFLSAAKVGGIHANNTYPVDFLQDNLSLQSNIIKAAYKNGVEKLMFLGSSCIYPRDAEQPITEEALLTGPLEPTNEWYAIAKIAGIKLCQAYHTQYGANFISAMPTNLYGPNDNFHPQNSHVPAALLSRFHHAKLNGDHEVVVWGTGKPMREFLHVDDLADACVHLMKVYKKPSPINVGTGRDITIGEFAHKIAAVTGFDGQIKFDTSKPDGTPRKMLNVAKLDALGWQSKIALNDGLKAYYEWYLENIG